MDEGKKLKKRLRFYLLMFKFHLNGARKKKDGIVCLPKQDFRLQVNTKRKERKKKHYDAVFYLAIAFTGRGERKEKKRLRYCPLLLDFHLHGKRKKKGKEITVLSSTA